MDKREFAIEVINRLKKVYEPKIALKFRDPWELLVATILSAQTTDERVNMITEKLFKKYKTIEDYIKVPLEELEQDIKSVNYYKTKAKNIKSCAQIILDEYGGKVPDTMEELLKLPGVARKTANVVLSAGYGKSEGIVVDTHVSRLSERFKLSEEKDRDKLEKELMSIIPQEEWTDFSYLLISHGRNVCKAKNPICESCILKDICPSAFKV
ncbi:MAG TPA: endonuclease III [Dictyoglomaceae bacterium]|nr:endonuclease III [Dictyoglomaceae bacterium]HOL39067.1 endonuclease III [Dictyoglomaceae bacterium]HOP94406.1 endonuclease III [Dictyoglomaceae bacterium]HPP15757.1 endonuclease III [Dictyoglomaceae bacterium]HPU42746.1 endonuclease III [Dictyoglomaceae bacterium]